MAAPIHSRLHPSLSHDTDARLPWWAVALPLIAFVALLLMIVNPAQAHASTSDPAVGRILERIHRTLGG